MTTVVAIVLAALLVGAHSSAQAGPAGNVLTNTTARGRYLIAYECLLNARQARRMVAVAASEYERQKEHSIGGFAGLAIGALVGVATGNPKTAMLIDSTVKSVADAIAGADDTNLKRALAEAQPLMAKAVADAKALGVENEAQVQSILTSTVASVGKDVVNTWLGVAPSSSTVTSNPIAVGVGGEGPYSPP